MDIINFISSLENIFLINYVRHQKVQNRIKLIEPSQNKIYFSQ